MIDLRRIVSREGPIDMGGRPVTITINTWVVALGGSYGRSRQRGVGQGGIGITYRHPSRVEVAGDSAMRPIHDHVLLVRFACMLAIATALLIRRRKS